MRKPKVSIGFLREVALATKRHGVSKANAATALGALVRDLCGDGAPAILDTVQAILDEVWGQ